MFYFIVSKSCLERAFVTLKRIIEHCVLVRLSGVHGVRGDEILRTNGGEEFAAFQRERDGVCCAPDPSGPPSWIQENGNFTREYRSSDSTVCSISERCESSYYSIYRGIFCGGKISRFDQK